MPTLDDQQQSVLDRSGVGAARFAVEQGDLPEISPGLMTFSVTSLPSPDMELIRTRPRNTAISEEPLSPR